MRLFIAVLVAVALGKGPGCRSFGCGAEDPAKQAPGADWAEIALQFLLSDNGRGPPLVCRHELIVGSFGAPQLFATTCPSGQAPVRNNNGALRRCGPQAQRCPRGTECVSDGGFFLCCPSIPSMRVPSLGTFGAPHGARYVVKCER